LIAEDFRVSTRFVLYHKTVQVGGKPLDVYGMGRFSVEPRKLGVGTYLVHAMEEIARRDGKACLLAFCDDSVLEFYIRKCRWFTCGRHGKLNIIASMPLQDVVVTETW
jgi:hypothetical protein